MSESHGALRSVVKSNPEAVTPGPDESRAREASSLQHRKAVRSRPIGRRKRAVSPVSISEAAALASQDSSRKRRMISNGTPRFSSLHPKPSTRTSWQSKFHDAEDSTPVTPCIDKDSVRNQKLPMWRSTSPKEYDLEVTTSSKTSSICGELEENKDETQILSPNSAITRSMSLREANASSIDTPEDSELQTPWRDQAMRLAMTPCVENDGDDSFTQFRQPPRPRPMVVNTTAAQDVSLPSPSLSPVTAAANLQSRREYFEQLSPVQSQHGSGRPVAIGNSQAVNSGSQSSRFTKGSVESVQSSQDPNLLDLTLASVNEQPSTGSLMSLPFMIDTFEALPEELKNYVVYQFLRRCSKSVLHFVADVVNPALKCDFLRLLPLELCINVIGNLDARTLCRTAQVSKRWRQLIDSSETVWKRLFDFDDYILPEGELQRAVHEGWGWQYASQSSESEKDLSGKTRTSTSTEVFASSLVPQDRSLSDALVASNSGSSTSQTKRPKRKTRAMRPRPPSGKQQKGKSKNTMDLGDETLIDMSSAEGPYAAAQIAAARVPYPPIGLPSLQNLHLFKSIYMRHHIIRKTWMADDVLPRHIAFRAHQRHVVTCLQFDAEKILTGSDDANINVYDTKSGALRARLEGHEGGVWALQYEGNVLVSGSTDRTVRVWDIINGRCTQIFQGHTSTVRCLQILMPTPIGKTEDGRPVLMPKQPLIITGSRDSNLRVWKLPKPGDPDFFQTAPAPDEAAECPHYVRTLAGHHHSVRAIAAHADTLVSGSYDCSVRVWRISTGETIHRLNGHSQKVYSVVLDTERNRCISGSMDNLVKVWSLETGSVLFNLEGHSSLVGLLDLQQDRLVSAAADSTLRIWDPENGHCRSTLSAHTGAITCFQHDGQKVISGSDRTLKMWNVINGEFAKDLLTDLSGVWQVKFNERRCVAAVQRNNLTYIEVFFRANHLSC